MWLPYLFHHQTLFGRICSVWLDSTGKSRSRKAKEKEEEWNGQALEDRVKEEELIWKELEKDARGLLFNNFLQICLDLKRSEEEEWKSWGN